MSIVRGYRLWFIVCMLAVIPLVAAGQSGNRNQTVDLGVLSATFEDLSAQVSPSVVQIISTGYTPTLKSVMGAENLLTKQRSSGSGVILDSDGYIVTNAHVVDGAQRIQVLLPSPPEAAPDGRSILKPRGELIGAQLVGSDPETDLAVIRIYRENLPYLQLADSDQLRQGQLVFAFGSPLGLENSVTMGVVSSIARQLAPEDPMIYIQTDASINPGNSGGPLVNADGEVVGINTFILSQSGGSEGIGFAAPSNIVEAVYTQLRELGRVHRGMIGVHAQTISPELARGLKLPRHWGVILGDVFPGSPAEKAGLQQGDVVLALDGKEMENGRQFDVNLYPRAVGQTVSVRVLRGIDTLVRQVTVVERPSDLNRFLQMVSPEHNLVAKLGILGLEMNSNIKGMLGDVRVREGVVVAANAATGLHWDGGFESGDVIFSANGRYITSLADLREAVAPLKPGDPLVVQVDRFGKQMYIAFDIQ
jgi:serine protease Do